MFAFRRNICNEIINALLSSIFSSLVGKNYKETTFMALIFVSQYLISSVAQKSSIIFSVKGFDRLLVKSEITPECFYSLF